MEELHNLEKKLQEIETAFGSLEAFVVASTFESDGHTLKTEAFSSCRLEFDSRLTRELELAELSDFWAGENGEFETR